ncbi:MAG: 3'-5' exonuclease [Bacteroidota bacterium]|nr:3'-5' exonuclease [Bacteroidota bacterium]
MQKSNTTFNTDISQIEFVVVDVETTGLNPENGDRVLEIAAVKLCGGAVIDTFNSLINPQRPISMGAYLVNRISAQMVANAPTFHEISDNFLKFVDNGIIAAYNTPFDLSFLNNELLLAGYPTLQNYNIDVLKLARLFLSGLSSYKQENVARSLNFDFPVKHRALEDVIVTSKILQTFISIVKAHGFSEFGDLLRRNIKQQLNNVRIETARTAMNNNESLWLKYFSPFQYEIYENVVTPIKISDNGKYQFITAVCTKTKSERNFHLDGIMGIKTVNSKE